MLLMITSCNKCDEIHAYGLMCSEQRQMAAFSRPGRARMKELGGGIER